MPKPPRSLLQALARDLTPAEAIRFDHAGVGSGHATDPTTAAIGQGAMRVSDDEKRSDLSRLLEAASTGDAKAADSIVPLVYDELRAIAAAQLRRMRPGATLDATSLVNEAYVRLVGRETSFANRRHFFFAAARAMRDVLVEHARRGQRRQEIHRERAVPSNAADRSEAARVTETMLALDELLPKLQQVDARAHDVVLLRFFCGLDTNQIADSLGVTQRTIERDWRFARSWLFDALQHRTGHLGGHPFGLPETARLCADDEAELP